MPENKKRGLADHEGTNTINIGWNRWSKLKIHFNCTIKLQIDTINPFLDKRVREEERGEWQRLFQTAASVSDFAIWGHNSAWMAKWRKCCGKKTTINQTVHPLSHIKWKEKNTHPILDCRRDNELRGYIVIWGISHCTAVAMQLPMICSALFSSIFPLGARGDRSYTALLWQQTLIATIKDPAEWHWLRATLSNVTSHLSLLFYSTRRLGNIN